VCEGSEAYEVCEGSESYEVFDVSEVFDSYEVFDVCEACESGVARWEGGATLCESAAGQRAMPERQNVPQALGRRGHEVVLPIRLGAPPGSAGQFRQID